MRILMSLAEMYFPPDIRVQKEAKTLIQAGHDVFLLCENREGKPSEELVDNIKVFRIYIPRSYLGRLWNGSCCKVYSPLWRKSLTHLVEQEKIDALHVHDLPMMKTGLSVARKFSIPMVADMHENYPVAIRVWRSNYNWRGKLINPIINSSWIWKQIEKFCVRRADRVIAVSAEAKEHYVNDCGVPSDKVTVVMNVENPDDFRSLPLEKSLIEKYRPYFIISYIGGFSHHRGIQTAITAMPEIVQEIPNARLLLVGSGTYENELRALAQEKKVAQAVEFTGQQPFSLMPSYINASQVCLVPYIFSEQTDASCPHKLFQYMAMGKPVVVSSVKSLRRIVSETGAGLVYTASDPDSLAQAVIRLYQDPKLAHKMGEAGKNAVEEEYNWQRAGGKLLDLYQSLHRK